MGEQVKSTRKTFLGVQIPVQNHRKRSFSSFPHAMLDGRKSRFPDFLAPSIAGVTAENGRKSHPGHHPHCYARVTGGDPGSPAVARLCDPFGAQAVWVGTQLACTLILLGPLPDHRRVALGASGSRATLTKFGVLFTPSPHYVPAASLA